MNPDRPLFVLLQLFGTSGLQPPSAALHIATRDDISKHQYGKYRTALPETRSKYHGEMYNNMKLHVRANYDLFLPTQKPTIKEKHPEKQGNVN